MSSREKWIVLSGSILFSVVFCYPLLTNLSFAKASHDWIFNLQLANAVIDGNVGWGHLDFSRCGRLVGKYHNLGINFINPESRILTPFILLQLIFGPATGLHLEIICHAAIGFAGACLLARELGCSQIGSVACAATFQASSGYYLHSGFGHVMFMGYAYAPWAALLFVQQRQCLTALVLALIYFECGLYPFMHVLLMTILIAFACALMRREIRPLTLLGQICLVGFVLMAVRLLPTLWFFGMNPRPWPLHGRGDVSNVLVDLFTRSTTFPPSATGSDGYYVVSNGAGWEFSCYWSPLLAILALWGAIKDFRRALPWLLVALVIVIAAAGPFSPWSPWALLHHFPGWGSQRLPARMLLVAMVPLGVLAGIGSDAVPPRVAVAIIALGLLDCWLIGPPNLWQALIPIPPLAT